MWGGVFFKLDFLVILLFFLGIFSVSLLFVSKTILLKYRVKAMEYS